MILTLNFINQIDLVFVPEFSYYLYILSFSLTEVGLRSSSLLPVLGNAAQIYACYKHIF